MRRAKKDRGEGEENEMREMEFDNPLANRLRASFVASPTTSTFEQEDNSPSWPGLSVDIPEAAGSPPAGASPGQQASPVETPTPRLEDAVAQGSSTDFELDLSERREGRRTLHYLVFMVTTLVLMPVYGLWFLFMGWVYYLVPNAIALVALVVSFCLPAVLHLGWRAASRRSTTMLQLYAFLLVLAVSLQVSMCLVMVLDNGAIRNGYIQSVTIAGRDVCESTGSLPWGYGHLPIAEICECFSAQNPDEDGALPDAEVVEGVTANSSAPLAPDVSINKTLCHTVEATNTTVCEVVESLGGCLRFVVDRDIGLTGPHVVAICIGTLCVELFLSFLAYTMMDDLDWKEQQRGSKRKGGLSVGTLQGEIVDAEGLKSGQVDTNHNGLGCRYAVLTLRSEDVAEKSHREYTAVTRKVEDDPSPDWNEPFQGWVMYECSKVLEIEVYDVIVEKKKKTREILIGSATVQIEGNRLPEQDYTMDGNEEEGPCSIELTWEPPRKKKDSTPQRAAAGTINIMLHRVPVPALLTRRSVSITQTWYFESTVLFMVFLSMVALALQSPAVPPPPDLYAALRILEIFVATHMGVELLLEMQPLLAAGKIHTCVFQGWWQLHVFVLVCNWASILMPAVTVATESSMASEVMGEDAANKLEKLFSVGRVLRIVRPLRTLRMIDNVEMIITTLQESLSLFGTVCLLLLFLMSILTLVGTSSYAGALQYTCIGEPGEGAIRPVCSAEQLARANDMGVECPVNCPPSLGGSGGKCEMFTYCAPLPSPRPIGADQFGFRDFDDFVRGLLTVFVQTTGDGGMHAMPLALYKAGVDTPDKAWLMSFCTSVLMNLLALNLFLAICCAAYSEVSARSDQVAAQKQIILDQMRDEQIRTETPEEKLVRETKEAEDAERQRPLEERLADKFWIPRIQDESSNESEGSRSRCSRVRNLSKQIVLSSIFETLSSLVIVGNTITMALSKEDMDEQLEMILFKFEVVFLVCYLMEAVLKFLAGGWKMYIESKANRFDLFVILASLLGFFATFFQEEVTAMLGGSADDQMGSMQSLRAVRLLRALQVVRLLNRSKSLIIMVQTIFQAWKPIMIHSVFSLFSMCMFAIIGMHLFGGSLGPGVGIEEYNRQLSTHFETFESGLLTTFEMTVGEDWAASMYWYMQNASEGHGYPPWVIAVFFSSMYLWMNCILFSLYVAMLLENFAVPEPDKMPTQKRMYDRQQRRLMRDLANVSTSVLEATVEQDLTKGYSQTEQSTIVQQFLTYIEGLSDETRNASQNKSLFLFSVDNSLRLRCARIQQSPWFSKMISCLIVFSCASLAAEGRGDSVELAKAAAAAKSSLANNPLHSISGLDIAAVNPMEHMPTTFLGKDMYFWINLLVLATFAYECLLKIIIHGFVFKSGPTEPYMRAGLNVLDFVVISLCLVAYLPGVPVAGQWARALRLGRMITPLLNLTKNPAISTVLISFVRAIPDTAVVMLPLVLMGVVFAIVGVAWFGGVLSRCIEAGNPLVELKQYQNETACLAMNNLTVGQTLTGTYEWSSPSFNFDDSPRSLATLFISMTDGTHGLMLKTAGTDISLKGFWIAFHITFTCLLLNLFLGVLSASFEKSSGMAVRTIGEKQWNGTRHMLFAYNPGDTNEEALRPSARTKCCGQPTPLCWFKLRSFFFLVSTDERAEMFWRGVIVANTMTLATDMYPTLPEHMLVVTYLNVLFLGLCGLEVTIKLIGFGPKAFFKNGWLVSDFILVTISMYYRLSGQTSGVEALRVMRVFRIVVLASKIPALVALIDVLITCIRASFGVIVITSLVVYLYSIIGMNLFGGLPNDERLEELGIPVLQAPILRLEKRLQGVACPSCSYYSDYSNFSDFTSSFKLLMQIVFGQELQPFVDDLQFIGADFWVTFAFFASFYIVTVWVCVNLLIVTVLSNFDAEQSGTIQEDEILPADMDGFAHTWAALTIGVHSAPGIKRKTTGILTRLKEELMETIEHLEGHETVQHKEASFDPEIVFEEGDPLLCGQLTVRIEQLEGLLPFRRPYCNVVAHGSNSTSVESRQTRTVPTKEKEGVASWARTLNKGKKDERTEDGESLVFHATEFHTHLTIEVFDTHKFCNEDIGVVTLSFHDLREMVSEQTLTVDLRQRHTEQNTYRVHGNKHRWDKYELNVGRAPDDEYNPQAIAEAAAADAAAAEAVRLAAEAKLAAQALAEGTDELADDELPDALEGLEDLVIKSHDKKAQKRHEKAVKEARKRQEKAEKAKKKQDKKNKKEMKDRRTKRGGTPSSVHVSDLGIGDEATVVEEDGIEWIDPFGHCPPNNRKLRLTCEFVPGLYEVPNQAFLSEHRVRFARMEQSCGVHGWLDISENGGPWKRRYCYMQDIPIRAMKFYRNAVNIGELEKLSSEKKEEIASIPGDRIMNIVGAQGKGRNQMRNRVFSIGVDEDVPNGKQIETMVGKISGTIVQAMYLKQLVFTGVRLVERVEFEEEAKIDEHEDDDDDDDEDENGDARDDLAAAVRHEVTSPSPRHVGTVSPSLRRQPSPKHVGNVSPSLRRQRGFSSSQADVNINPEVEIEPTRYMAAKRAALRAESDLNSEKVGAVMKKEVVVVFATRFVGDVLRLKTERGWCSAISVDGRNTLMIAENSKTTHYRVKKKCKIGRFVQLSTCHVDGLGYLDPGQVVEVLESKNDPETTALRHRIAPIEDGSEAWISDIDIDATATPDPYCVVETFNQPRGKEMKKLTKYKTPKPDRAQTAVVDDNLTPVWEHNFVLEIVPSTRKILVHVHNDSASSTMGEAEFELLSSSLVKGIPGPVLRGSCIEGGEVRLGKEATDIKVQLVTPTDKKGQGGAPAGTVVLRLAYNEIVPEAVLLEKLAEYDGDVVAGMLTEERKRVKWSFKASSNKESRAWLSAMRWLAEGFLRYAPKSLEIPPKPLVRTELERVRKNLVLLDLPFSRINQLLKGLYKRKVMGKRKPTLRRMVYTVFQLELHAWSMSIEQQQHKRVKRRANVQGEYLEDLRGLHFQQVLERLSIIHYGKHRCLSYADQMDEYQLEVNHISLQILQTCISMWLFKRRIGRTVGGYMWPSNPVWAQMPETFELAIEGIATTRMRSLGMLRGEVERRSRPALIDTELPKKQRLTDKLNGADGGGAGVRRFLSCKKTGRDRDVREVDIMDMEDGAPVAQNLESADERQTYAATLSKLTPAEVDAVYDAVDTDKDGSLSAEELRNAIVRLTGRTIGAATLVRLVTFLDKDRNGSIDRSEFREGISKFARATKAGAFEEEDSDSDLDELEATQEELKKALLRPVNE